MRATLLSLALVLGGAGTLLTAEPAQAQPRPPAAGLRGGMNFALPGGYYRGWSRYYVEPWGYEYYYGPQGRWYYYSYPQGYSSGYYYDPRSGYYYYYDGRTGSYYYRDPYTGYYYPWY